MLSDLREKKATVEIIVSSLKTMSLSSSDAIHDNNNVAGLSNISEQEGNGDKYTM